MDGLIIVNKEKNYTSRDVVNVISKVLNQGSVGHTGTLDPLAEGVLVVAVGKALRVIEFLTNDTKEYLVEVRIGIDTDTLDITGNVLKKTSFSIDKKDIIDVLNSFIGKSIQEVPLYSAIKVNGKRLYDYARHGINVDLPKREIEIFNIEFISLEEDIFTFEVKVSKGTYIRSLIRDIGKKLNIPCCMNNLRRTKQGIFSIEESYTIGDIKDGKYELISSDIVFNNYNKVKVDSFIESKVMNGRILENRYDKFPVVFINNNNKVLGIYDIYSKDNTKIKPVKVFK